MIYEDLSSQNVLVHVVVHSQTTLPCNKLMQFFCCKQRMCSSVSKWVHIAEHAERHFDLKDPRTPPQSVLGAADMTRFQALPCMCLQEARTPTTTQTRRVTATTRCCGAISSRCSACRATAPSTASAAAAAPPPRPASAVSADFRAVFCVLFVSVCVRACVCV